MLKYFSYYLLFTIKNFIYFCSKIFFMINFFFLCIFIILFIIF